MTSTETNIPESNTIPNPETNLVVSFSANSVPCLLPWGKQIENPFEGNVCFSVLSIRGSGDPYFQRYLKDLLGRVRAEYYHDIKRWNIPNTETDTAPIDSAPTTQHIVLTEKDSGRIISSCRLVNPYGDGALDLFNSLEEGVDIDTKEEEELLKELSELVGDNGNVGDFIQTPEKAELIERLGDFYILERLAVRVFDEGDSWKKTRKSLYAISALFLSLPALFPDSENGNDDVKLLVQIDSQLFKLLRMAFGNRAIEIIGAVPQRRADNVAELCLTAVVDMSKAISYLSDNNPAAFGFLESLKTQSGINLGKEGGEEDNSNIEP